MTVGTSLGVSMITGLFDSDPNSPMSIKKRAPFELRVGTFVNYELEVLSFRGKERVNDIYRYEVTFATDLDEEQLHSSLFGEPACLTIKAPGYDPRVIQGIAVSLEGLGGVPGEQKTGRLRYRLEIVPKLWLMKQRRKNRVFQHKSAIDIVKSMLTEIGMKASESEWHVPREDAPPLTFVYQRNESDFDFARRVLADAGIFFFFQHASDPLAGMKPSGGGEKASKLTFAFQPNATLTIAHSGGGSATVPFDDGMGASPDDDRVYEFGLKKLLRTKTIRMHEHDVELARNWVEVQALPSPGSGNSSTGSGAPFDVDTSPLNGSVLRQELYQIDPSLPSGKKAGHLDNARMKVELARMRRRFLEAQGKSDCRRLAAGYRFTLTGHPIKALNQEYLAVSVSAEGTHPDYAKDAAHVYRSRVGCIPSAYAPIPPRPKKRPKLGIELAQVVAYSDIKKVPWLESSPNGYVKVRFRWDIANDKGAPTGMLAKTDHASGTEDHFAIWVPVLQPWAGAGYGAQFIPREGMEVAIGFLEDQGERPVILGCLYSGANQPPWHGKADQQKVGIKSQTRAHDGGWSEVSLDDRQGKEMLTIRAQADLTATVLQDQTVTVGGQATTSVAGDTTRSTTGALTENAANRTDTTTGTVTEAIGGDRSATIGGDLTINVAGDTTTTLAGAQTESVGLDSTVTYQGARIVHVDGLFLTTVGNEGKDTARTDIYVHGDSSVGNAGNVLVNAVKSIVFQCGSSVLSMTPNGIYLGTKTLALAGSETATLSGNGPALTLDAQAELAAKTVNIYSTGASLELASGATLGASAIKLTSSADSSAHQAAVAAAASTKEVTLVLNDSTGSPYANKTYVMTVDGNAVKGTTDGNGKLVQTVDSASLKATVTAWLDQYPEGRRQRWHLDLVPSLEPAESTTGALHRLRHMGHFTGTPSETLDAGGAQAVKSFQRAQGLKETGELDTTTVATLKDKHGG